jgi:hypothetical protein
MSHACNSTKRHLIQGIDNYDGDNYEDFVRGQDEAESTGLNWIIPGTRQCHVMSTRMSLLWNSIHRGMTRLPRDTWSLHTDEATTTGCTLPPFARTKLG